MGRKQKHNRLKVEQGGVTAVYSLEYDGSLLLRMHGDPEHQIVITGAELAALVDMARVGMEQQEEDRVLSEQFREIARQRKLAEEPIPEQPEGLPEF